MGVEPFLIASTLEAVLAQRLVRRICPHCRTVHRPPATLLQQLALDPREVGAREFFHGRGCAACVDTGYRGRLGLFEWMRLTEPLRELVVERTSTQALRKRAREQGMRSLREDGLRAIFEGSTTIAEVVKYT
jgi:type IV pilus assembly protein PilB